MSLLTSRSYDSYKLRSPDDEGPAESEPPVGKCEVCKRDNCYLSAKTDTRSRNLSIVWVCDDCGGES